ncbi:MAG: OadG family protein [Spirochaetaceae bacterium]|jgi:oxaloacetate decarboxylase gamma subunit|nr:OadG family protein [Spirochaetaceae bacterium]
MTIAEMLGQSGKMAVIGMGIVFSFLIILIVSVTLMGKIIRSLGLDADGTEVKSPGRPVGAASQAAIVAAIGAAVTQYRQDNG